MMSKSLLKVIAVVKMVQWVAKHVEFTVLGVDFNLFEISHGIGWVTEKFEEGMGWAAEHFTDQIAEQLKKLNIDISPINAALQAMPGLGDLPDLPFFSIPSVELPSLKSTSWVPICVVAVAVLFILVEIAAVFLGTEFRALSDALKAMLVSAFGAVVVFIVNLYYQMYLWDLSIAIDWNDSIWIYVTSIVMFSIGILFSFIGSDEAEQERLELNTSVGVSGGRGGALYGRVSTSEKPEPSEMKLLKPADYPLTVKSGRR